MTRSRMCQTLFLTAFVLSTCQLTAQEKTVEPQTTVFNTLNGQSPREVLSHWNLEIGVDGNSESNPLLSRQTVNTPPIPLGFFCKFEDNLNRKLGFGIDFGTFMTP